MKQNGCKHTTSQWLMVSNEAQGCKHTLSQWLMVSNEAEWLQTHPQPMANGK
jgi:hypothetical protein